MDSSPLFAGCSLSTLSLCLPPIFCMSACLSINGSSNDEWVSCWSDLHCCHPSKYESSQHTERSQRPQVPCRFVHAIKLEHFCLLTSNSHQHHTQTSKQQCCSIDNSGPLVRGGAPPQSTDELCRLSRWTAEVVVGFIKVSVRQKRSGLWVSTRSHSAAERRGWRISGCWECTEWRLKDRGWVQCRQTEEQTKEQKKTAEAKGAWSSKQQEGGESGTVEAGVLLAGGMVWWGMVCWSVRPAKRECGRPKKKCRGEKENERIVQKMHSAGSSEASGER